MSTDESNKIYWSELSGSRATYKLKIVHGDPMGAEKFDDWFFWYYPYLDNEQFIPWSSLNETKVLEIGLGYGSVGRRIAETGANYTDSTFPLVQLDTLLKLFLRNTRM